MDTELYKHITVFEVGSVTLVRLRDKRISGADIIAEVAREIINLTESRNMVNMLLSLENVRFLSSAALGKFVTFDSKARATGVKLSLCSIREEIFYILEIARLTGLFNIKESEEAALADFNK